MQNCKCCRWIILFLFGLFFCMCAFTISRENYCTSVKLVAVLYWIVLHILTRKWHVMANQSVVSKQDELNAYFIRLQRAFYNHIYPIYDALLFSFLYHSYVLVFLLCILCCPLNRDLLYFSFLLHFAIFYSFSWKDER